MEPTQSMPKKTNVWVIVSIILGLALIGIIVSELPQTGENGKMSVVPADQAADGLLNFINEVYGSQLGPVTLQGVNEENGLYKISLNVTNQGQSVIETVFVTRDGKLFVPQAIDIEEGLSQFRSFQEQNLQTATEQKPTTTNEAIQN